MTNAWSWVERPFPFFIEYSVGDEDGSWFKATMSCDAQVQPRVVGQGESIAEVSRRFGRKILSDPRKDEAMVTVCIEREWIGVFSGKLEALVDGTGFRFQCDDEIHRTVSLT